MSQGTERIERAREVGSRVRRLRERQMITQGELAARAGVSLDVVSRLELGKRLPHAPNLRKIADALGVAILGLMEGGAEAEARLDREEPVPERGALPGQEAHGRPRVVLALAHRRGGENDGEDLEEILGGADALGELQRLLEDSRGGVLAGVGLRDYSDAPRLAPGEGLSDEIESQRDGRHF